jgi:hypothetical protein
MTAGLAAAVENPACMPADGSVRLAVIQFSTESDIEIPLTQITAANAAAVANEIRTNIPHEAGFTNWEAGIDNAIAALQFNSAKQIMNFMSDGIPNRGSLDINALRERAVAGGFDEIDAEGVKLQVDDAAVGNLRSLVYPQPGNVVTSLDPAPVAGWVLVSQFAQGYADSICRKMQLVLVPILPPDGEGPVAKCHPVTPLSTFDKKGYTAYTREYMADATDPDTPVDQLQIYIKDTGSGTVWGPFPSGVTFKYNWDVRATPGIKPSTGNAMYIIKGTGPAEVYAVDPTPNMSPVASCPVD